MLRVPAPASPAEFRLASHRVGTDVWVISLSGDCGDSAGADLGRQLASLPRGRSAHAVVDLTAATSIRARFVSEIVTSAREARKNSIETTIISEDGAVRQALGEAEDEGSLKLERLLATGIRDALAARLA